MTERRLPRGTIDFVLAPFPSESITSWYVRLARANAISLHELASKLIGHSVHSIACTDLDTNANPAIPDALARTTGVLAEETKLMTLSGWQSWLSAEVDHPKRATRWILPQMKDVSARRRGEWTHACLQCLAADAIPYFRVHWRFAFVTECVEHRVEMVASCPHCSEPLDFPRMDRGSPRPQRHWPLSKCPTCAADWRVYAHRQRSSDIDVWRLQRKLLRAIARRWFVLDGDPVWTALILDGLYVLLRSLRTPKVAARLSLLLLADREAPAKWTSTRTALEYLPLRERRALLKCAAKALGHWPKSFIVEAERYDLRMSILHASPLPTPYWIDRVAREYLDRTWFRQSPAETRSAVAMLARRGLSAKPWVIREWLGFYVPKRQLCIGPADDGRQLRIFAVDSEADRRLRQAFVARVAGVLRKWCLRRSRTSTTRLPLEVSRLPRQTSMTLAISSDHASN